MKRLFPFLLAIGTLVLVMTPVQAQSHAFVQSSSTDMETHLFSTADFAHIIAVIRVTEADSDAAGLLVNEGVAEYFIKKFNAGGGADLFVNYRHVSGRDHPVRYADASIVYIGESHFESFNYDTSRLTLSQVGADIFIVIGMSPTDTYYRYVNACNKMDDVRPVPHGYREYDQSTGTWLPEGQNI